MVHVLCRRSLVLLVALLSASLGTGCRRSDGMTVDVLDGVKYRILVQPGAPRACLVNPRHKRRKIMAMVTMPT